MARWRFGAVMPCGWEGNHRSDHASQTSVWFIHLRAHGLRKGGEHPAYTPRTVAHFTFTFPVIYIHTYIHPFNGPLPGTTRVSRYQKGKTIWILLKQEAVSGSGISWAVCKSAPRFRPTTTPAPHHSVFYRPDALPAAQPTASKH